MSYDLYFLHVPPFLPNYYVGVYGEKLDFLFHLAEWAGWSNGNNVNSVSVEVEVERQFSFYTFLCEKFSTISTLL